MSKSFSRAHEKFSRAASTLATSPKDLKERLFDAAGHVVALEPEEMPDEMRVDFLGLRQQLTSGPPVPGGSLRTTIDLLSIDEAANIAAAIWSFHCELSEQRYRELGNG